MKSYIIGSIILVTVGSMMSCDNKEKLALQQKVDSLNVQLANNEALERNMNEVGILIDSIDANRKSLELNMVEGKSNTDRYEKSILM